MLQSEANRNDGYIYLVSHLPQAVPEHSCRFELLEKVLACYRLARVWTPFFFHPSRNFSGDIPIEVPPSQRMWGDHSLVESGLSS